MANRRLEERDQREMNAAIAAELKKTLAKKGYHTVCSMGAKTYYKRRRDGHALIVDRDAIGRSLLTLLDDAP